MCLKLENLKISEKSAQMSQDDIDKRNKGDLYQAERLLAAKMGKK